MLNRKANRFPKRNNQRIAKKLIAGALSASMLFTPFLATSGVVYAAEVVLDDKESWIDAYSDYSLAGDTAPIVEGTGTYSAYTHIPALQQSKSIGRVSVWNSEFALNLSDSEVGPTPWAFNPVDTLLNHYGVSTVRDLPFVENGLITTDGIPYMIPGLTFSLFNGELYYAPFATDYSKMSPLGSEGVESFTFNGIVTWKFPEIKVDSTTPLTAGNALEIESTFTPAKAYAGPVPALPLYINDANGDPQLHYLTTGEAEPTTIPDLTRSADLYTANGGIQTQ